MELDEASVLGKPDRATMMSEKDVKRFAKIEKSIFQAQPVDVHSTVKKLNDTNEFISMQ